MPTSDTTGCFQEHMSICSIVMSVHMIHQYLSECRAVKYPRLVIKQRHENVFLCIYRLSSTVDDCSSNVVSALSDSKYTWVPLAHARPFITCRVNNPVLCILLSRSNDEWTCIYMLEASVPFPVIMVPIEPMTKASGEILRAEC